MCYYWKSYALPNTWKDKQHRKIASFHCYSEQLYFLKCIFRTLNSITIVNNHLDPLFLSVAFTIFLTFKSLVFNHLIFSIFNIPVFFYENHLTLFWNIFSFITFFFLTIFSLFVTIYSLAWLIIYSLLIKPLSLLLLTTIQFLSQPIYFPSLETIRCHPSIVETITKLSNCYVS